MLPTPALDRHYTNKWLCLGTYVYRLTVMHFSYSSASEVVHSYGVRRSRRLKKEGILASSATNEKMPLANTINERHDHHDTDSVFYPQGQPFVRNVASRRNTRSRKSTVSSTTSGGNGESKSPLTSVRVPLEVREFKQCRQRLF